MTYDEKLAQQRQAIIEIINDALPTLPALLGILDRRTVTSAEETRLLFLAADISANVLSYAVFSGAGAKGLLDAMSAHVAERVAREGGAK